MKNRIALLLIVVLISAFSIEIATRTYLPDTSYHPQWRVKLSGFPEEEIRGEMALRYSPGTKNISVEYKEGEFREVNNTYYRYGFKRWGDTETNQTKVLILGDSHTWMRKVSNGNEWYAYLEEEFPQKEFFVMGQGGFGTTHELIVLKHMVDRINPDIILLQFCGNDFMDNSYRWKRAIYPIGGTFIAPFLMNGSIELWAPYKKYREKSKVIDFLSSKLQYMTNTGKFLPFVSDWASRKLHWTMKSNPEIPEIAFNKTRKLITRMEKVSGNSSLHLLLINGSKDGQGPHYPDKYKICEKINVSCIKGIDEHVAYMEEKKNRSMHVVGGKYNREGNRLAGEYIADYLKEHDIMMEKDLLHNSTDRSQ